jgi:hypothetical protein
MHAAEGYRIAPGVAVSCRRNSDEGRVVLLLERIVDASQPGFRGSPDRSGCQRNRYKPIWLLHGGRSAEFTDLSGCCRHGNQQRPEAGIVFETGLKTLPELVTRPRSGCTSRGLAAGPRIAPFVLAFSIWLLEGPAMNDLMTRVKVGRNAPYFCDSSRAEPDVLNRVQGSNRPLPETF